MGKKSRRKIERPNKGAGAKMSAPPGLAKSIEAFMNVGKFAQAKDLEIKWGHLDTFGGTLVEDIMILRVFGYLANGKRVLYYCEKAIRKIETNEDEQFQIDVVNEKAKVGHRLTSYYAEKGEMEKALSNHHKLCLEGEVRLDYIIDICDYLKKGNHNKKIIEFIESMKRRIDAFTPKDQVYCLLQLCRCYAEDDDFLKARIISKKAFELAHHLEPDVQHSVLYSAGRIEMGLCNYKATIRHFMTATKISNRLHMEMVQPSIEADLGIALLRTKTKNPKEAFRYFAKALDAFTKAGNMKELQNTLICMANEYRKLNQLDLSLQCIERCQSLAVQSRLDVCKEAHCNALLEYAYDTTLSYSQRKLYFDKARSIVENTIDDCASATVNLTRARLYNLGGNQNEARTSLVKYVHVRLELCELNCYTCKQKVKEGTVPLMCQTCLVALYCNKKHQALSWNDDRICHKVLCPLLARLKKFKAGEPQDDQVLLDELDNFLETVFGKPMMFALQEL